MFRVVVVVEEEEELFVFNDTIEGPRGHGACG